MSRSSNRSVHGYVPVRCHCFEGKVGKLIVYWGLNLQARPTNNASGGTVLAEESYVSKSQKNDRRLSTTSAASEAASSQRKGSRIGNFFRSFRSKRDSNADSTSAPQKSGSATAAAASASAPTSAGTSRAGSLAVLPVPSTQMAAGSSASLVRGRGETLVNKLNADKGKSDNPARWSYIAPEKLLTAADLY
jgi:hypothetical protein